MFQNITQIVRKSYSFNDPKWRMMTLSCSEKLSALLREITSKHHVDFYCLNCLHSFVTENKRESHIKVCENKDFCNIIMPSEDTKILEFNQNKKSDKRPFIIYADLEWLIEKIHGCKNNPENSFTTKVGEHIQVFQCLQYYHLEAWKRSIMYTEGKIA